MRDAAPDSADFSELAANFSPPSPQTTSKATPVRVPEAELRPVGAGRFEAAKTTFVAKVAPDGSVRFEDKPNITVRLPCLTCLADGMGQGLAAWARDPYGYGRQMEGPDEMVVGRPMVKEMTNLPTATQERKEHLVEIELLGAGFDLTDAVLRALGKDPYAYEKLAFLKRTDQERTGMALRYRSQTLRDALKHLPGLLTKIWTHDKTPIETRRRVLFELWDECAEQGEPEVVAAAANVRATVLTFIQKNAPAGSRCAYAGDELDALNAHRHSTNLFAPY